MRGWLFGIPLVALLLAGRLDAAGPPGGWVDDRDPAFQYLGVWREGAEGRHTIHPGSQVRFRLKGKAHVVLKAERTESVLVALRMDGRVIWRGTLGQETVMMDGGDAGGLFSIVYLAARHPRFNLEMPDAAAAELNFQGVQMVPGGALEAPPQLNSDVWVDFIGDSITVGDGILGRSEAWDQDFDASLSFAFKLAEILQFSYRIQAVGGARGGQIVSQYAAVQQAGMPVPDGQPDLVFVNVGANNRSMDADQYRVMMRKLLDQIFAMHPETRVVLLNFFRMTPNRLPTLRELARAYPSGAVTCFDARAHLVGYSDGGVHPNAESHSRLALALADLVRHDYLKDNQSGHHPGINSVPVP